MRTDSADAAGAEDTLDVLGAREELPDEKFCDAALDVLAGDTALDAVDASVLLVAKDAERGFKDAANKG